MKFSSNQSVLIKKNNQTVKINDYEVFDNLVLYYTNDGKAYPEDDLEYIEYFAGCFHYLLCASEERKEKDFQDIIKKYNIDINF